MPGSFRGTTEILWNNYSTLETADVKSFLRIDSVKDTLDSDL